MSRTAEERREYDRQRRQTPEYKANLVKWRAKRRGAVIRSDVIGSLLQRDANQQYIERAMTLEDYKAMDEAGAITRPLTWRPGRHGGLPSEHRFGLLPDPEGVRQHKHVGAR